MKMMPSWVHIRIAYPALAIVTMIVAKRKIGKWTAKDVTASDYTVIDE
jgi:hypothetical protein